MQIEIEKVRKRREEYAAMKEQMEEEKAVIDRERAIAEGRDAEIKEEEVSSSRVASPLCCLLVHIQLDMRRVNNSVCD